MEEINIDKMLKLRNLDRRNFLKFCGQMAAVLGLSQAYIPKIASAIEKASKRPPVVWLHFAECTGDSEAFIRTVYPSIGELVLDVLSIDYHETIMAAAGTQAEENLQKTVKDEKGKYICIVEGAIPTKDNGIYLTIAGKTGIEIAKEVCGNAFATICVGNCACYGGVQAQYPNPTGAKGVKDAIGIKTVNIPACPHNPKNSVATVVNYLLFGKLPDVDKYGRPLFAFYERIHDHCPRRAHFDAGQFVEEFGSEEAKKEYCLYKMGCKGPETYNNCSKVLYNDMSWPIAAGHGCVGCSEPNFWDAMQPFYERLPGIRLPGGGGVETTVDNVGFAMAGAAAAGIAAHAVYTFTKKTGSAEESGKERGE